MRKTSKIEASVDQQKALEIIELAANDLETLARAFTLISEVCKGDVESASLTESADDIVTVH